MVLGEASRRRVRWSTLCVVDAKDVVLVVKLWWLFVGVSEVQFECH